MNEQPVQDDPNVKLFTPDPNNYETLVFATKKAFVDHFIHSAVEAQEFMCKLAKREMCRQERKLFRKDIRKIAEKEYENQPKDEEGKVVLRLPKHKEFKGDIPEGEPVDCLSVYLFTRNQTAYFRGEVTNGELFPDFVNDYLNDMRWVKQLAEMDQGKLVCLFCQNEMDEDKQDLVMKKVSARIEEKLVEAKCWLTCKDCEDRIPTWTNEEELYKARGVGDKDYKFVQWGPRKVDVVIPTQRIYFTTNAPPTLAKP